MESTALINLPINPESKTENQIDDKEHTRQLLYEILRERGINFDSVIGEKIDENSDIKTLLRVIQSEKEKKKGQSEISYVKSSSTKHKDLQIYKHNFVNEYWRLVNELNRLWFSYLVLNPFITWLATVMCDD